MQLDKTQISIRERGWLEILDLALAVLRVHGLPLLAALAVGAVPLALFNGWLFRARLRGDLSADYPAEFTWAMCLAMLIELPLATAPMTLYLGQLLFDEKPRAADIARAFTRCLPQMLLLQVLLRALVILPVITWFLPYAMWPYLNEVILLERNRLIARRPGELSTRRRSSALHAGTSGDALARSFAALCLALGLIGALWLSVWFLRALLGGPPAADWTMYGVVLPAMAWLVVGFFTVVRFLGYLDLRIRREGWELELMLRAERARLTRQLT